MWLVRLGADIAFTIAAVGAATFVLAYVIGSAWRSSMIGRAIMRFFSIIAVIMALVVLFTHVRGDDRVVAWLSLILYTAFAVEMWRLVYVLIRTQRQERRERSEYDERTDSGSGGA